MNEKVVMIFPGGSRNFNTKYPPLYCVHFPSQTSHNNAIALYSLINPSNFVLNLEFSLPSSQGSMEFPCIFPRVIPMVPTGAQSQREVSDMSISTIPGTMAKFLLGFVFKTVQSVLF